MKSRILVAAVGIPALLYVVLAAPPIVMALALIILAGVGAMELQQCVSGTKKAELAAFSTLWAGLTVGWYFNSPERVTVLFLLGAVFFFGYAILRGGEVKFSQIMAGLFGSIAIGCSFSAFLRLEASGVHRAYLLLPFILSFACDTFAFFAGLTLGKHKLAPKVSPKKTVEGALWGTFSAACCSCG